MNTPGVDVVRWSISFSRDEVLDLLKTRGYTEPESEDEWGELMQGLQTAVENCTAGEAIDQAMDSTFANHLDPVPEDDEGE
jgi:hypothetical protein